MSWTKIKTIIICFLVAMNLFVAAYIAITTFRDSHIPDEVVDASLKILKRDGFECNKEIIPTKMYTLPSLDATFYTADNLSEMFFKKQLPFRTDKDSLIAVDEGATLTVTANYFSYVSSKEADKSCSEEEIKEVLMKSGFDMEGAVYDKKERCFYKMHNDINLFNMYLKAELDKSGNIASISAQWPVSLTELEDDTLSFASGVTKVKNAFPEGGKITQIEPGYALIHQGGNRYIFKPSWRVKVGKNLKILE